MKLLSSMIDLIDLVFRMDKYFELDPKLGQCWLQFCEQNNDSFLHLHLKFSWRELISVSYFIIITIFLVWNHHLNDSLDGQKKIEFQFSVFLGLERN